MKSSSRSMVCVCLILCQSPSKSLRHTLHHKWTWIVHFRIRSTIIAYSSWQHSIQSNNSSDICSSFQIDMTTIISFCRQFFVVPILSAHRRSWLIFVGACHLLSASLSLHLFHIPSTSFNLSRIDLQRQPAIVKTIASLTSSWQCLMSSSRSIT